MPLFSEQDNPASFSPHLLTRSVSNPHAHTTKQTQTHQLSTFPVTDSNSCVVLNVMVQIDYFPLPDNLISSQTDCMCQQEVLTIKKYARIKLCGC